jgi:hypothetical protein
VTWGKQIPVQPIASPLRHVKYHSTGRAVVTPQYPHTASP